MMHKHRSRTNLVSQATWSGLAALFLVAAVLGLGLHLIFAAPEPSPLAAAQTVNLHSADVVVNGVTFNTLNTNAVVGTLDTATAASIPQQVETVLKDAANISIFASDPVPTGTVWNLAGTWTFNPYIRTSISDRGWVRARVYRINTDGTTAQLLYAQNGTRYDTTTSYQLMNWTASMAAGTVLQAGQRFGVVFYFFEDNGGAPTVYLGFDHSSAPSNVIAQVAVGSVREAHYRIGQDTALTAMTWYAAVDTGATNVATNTSFRVRFQLYNNGAANMAWTPQLEWTSTSGSGYAAVPTATTGTPFFLADTTQFTNAASIATGNFGLGTGTGTAQAGVAYDTQNPAGAAVTLNASSYTEIEFNIKVNGNATAGTTYYFRLTNSGSVLVGYDVEARITIQIPGNVRQAHYRIATDTALTAMTWYAAVDTTATSVPQNTNFRVRFQLYNSGDLTSTWTSRLDWSATLGGSYAAVPTTSGGQFVVTDTAQFANAASIGTAYFGLGTGTGTAIAGTAYDTQNPAGAAINLNAHSYTEVEFNIQATSSSTPGSTYYFKLTNNGTALAAYDVTAAAVTIQSLNGVLREAHFRIGQDSPLTSMTWYAAVDTGATAMPTSTAFRVRFQLYNNGASSANWTPQLEWSATQGSGYAAVPVASGAPPFFLTDTAQFINAASIGTAYFGLGTGTGSAQAGVAYDTQNPAGATFTLNAYSYAEIEFNIQGNSNASAGATYYFRLTNAGTALTAYDTSDATVRMLQPGLVRQAHYRIGNDTPLTSMTWYAARDTVGANVMRNANVRVRFQVYNDGDLSTSFAPQLEVSATQGSGYAAVPTTSGVPPFYVIPTMYANGDPIATAYFGLDPGTGVATAGIAYDTQNPATGAITLNAGAYTEIEFNVQANLNAAWSTSYYFRLTDNGAALASYSVYAQVTMEPATPYVRSDHYRVGQDTPLTAMTWYAAADTPVTALPRSTNFRVRFQIYNNGGANATLTPALEWSASSGSGYATVPTATGAPPFFVVNTTQFANGVTITSTYFYLGTGVGSAQNGIGYDTQNPAGAPFTLLAGSYTEIEFSAQANANASEGASYYLRLTNNGTVLTAYEHPAAQVIVQTTPPPTPTYGPPAHNGSQPYSVATEACAYCHRAHTSPAPQAIVKKYPQEQACYTCHDGTGAPNIMAQFNKTYRMPISTTSSKHTLTETRSRLPSAFSGDNRHVTCTDCHNPHYAAQGNHTVGSAYIGGPQQGVWGITASYSAAWTAPTFATTSRITYQYELCFKCHSSWAFGSSPPTSPSSITNTPTFLETDVSKDFNPLNAGFMPVVAQGKNPFRLANGTSYASSLIGGFTPTSRMVCSDCHGSETSTDPAGPHGSNNPFILKGLWNRTTGQSGTSNHLCFRCHAFNVYGTGATAGSNATGFSDGSKNLHALMVGARNKAYNDNPMVCMDCHVAVTHGYNNPHLIGYTGDGTPYVNRPYSGGMTVVNSYASSGQWSFNNCSTAMGSCK